MPRSPKGHGVTVRAYAIGERHRLARQYSDCRRGFGIPGNQHACGRNGERYPDRYIFGRRDGHDRALALPESDRWRPRRV